MDWLKKLFGIMDKTADRVKAAGDRIATAAEQMAAEWEAMRKSHRERFAAVPMIEETGRRKRVTA